MPRLLCLGLCWSVVTIWPSYVADASSPTAQRSADAPAASVDKSAEPRVRVQFAPGRSTVALEGQVQGYQTVDYVIDARGQQRLTVRVTSRRPLVLMGIYAPDGEAVCVESCGLQWTHVLRQAGDYTIRIGLARAEARRGGRVSYTLQVSLGPP